MVRNCRLFINIINKHLLCFPLATPFSATQRDHMRNYSISYATLIAKFCSKVVE